MEEYQNLRGQEDDIVWDKVPEKRKSWRATLVSLFICISVTIGIIVYGLWLENEVDEYEPVNELSTTILKEISNGSIKCYTKAEKKTYPVFFNLCLGLLSIILGTFVDRLSLIFEEMFHFTTRYKRKPWKMLKACFSGIPWLAVFLLSGFLILVIIVSLALKKAGFELYHVTYVLSGIGVGPLVMHLLNMNTQSEVHISTILEERENFVANGLAWSYYFNYLDKALPKFREKFPINRDGEEQVRLNLNRLILLISHNCVTTENLENQDDTIKKLIEICDGKFRFPVYEFTYDGIVHRYVIKYMMQPLHTLQKMSQYERIKSLSEKELEYQVKMFYKTLSDIVKEPFNNDHRERCLLVAMKAESIASLDNGGLVRYIMHGIKNAESASGHGFIMVPPAQNNREAPMENKSTPDAQGHRVAANPGEGTSRHTGDQHSGTSIDNHDLTNKTPTSPVPEQRHPCNTETSTQADVHVNPEQLTRESEGAHTASINNRTNLDDKNDATNNEL